MVEDSFFDTNIIIDYASYYDNSPIELHKKSFLYIKNKSGKFILCHAVLREIFSVINKRSIIYKEVLRKIENSLYSLDESQFLAKRDIPYAKKLYERYKNIDKTKLSKILAEERKLLEIRIEQFLKNKVDERVVPLDQISTDITNTLRDMIDNYADCQILASALQHQKTRPSFFFVTADKHFDPNTYAYLKDYKYLKEFKFPDLKNFLYDS